MTITFRPAKRVHTPLIVGLAGPTKSGKTMSAHRLAVGLAQGGPVAMINAEGAKGHQYSDKFQYVAADLTPPFRPERYTEALTAALALDPKPAVVIIDSGSHMHDGPGGLLEYHDQELDRMAGTDQGKRARMTWAAWIRPKAAENEFIYTMLGADSHIIICFRAKEKLKIVRGQDPVDLGWQPIAGERVAFETIFTLTLPPHSKGVPDLAVSEMREPFDTLIPAGEQLSEETGRVLAKWAAGGAASSNGAEPAGFVIPASVEPLQLDEQEARLLELAEQVGKRDVTEQAIAKKRRAVESLDPAVAQADLSDWLQTQIARAEAVVA